MKVVFLYPDSKPAADVPTDEAPPARPPIVHGTARWKIAIAVIVLILSALLLFVRLGHYALWDDESLVALIGENVWKTGDTGAMSGHNIVAYRSGLLLKNLKDRSSPPLQYYLVAPFEGLFGRNTWAVRLPFASLGLACVGLMLWWLHKDEADIGAWTIFGITLIGNVSFFLYFRQCRYYAPAMFLSTAIAYLYLHATTRRGITAMAVLSILLLAANYLMYASTTAMLLVDYAVWGRKRRTLSPTEWAILLIPQVLIGGLIVWIWDPRSIDAGAERGPWIADKVRLLWWNLRDLNNCEYTAALVLLAAPIVGMIARQKWILRAWVALLIGVVTIVAASPQMTHGATVADVRYLSGLIPLCIALGVLTIRSVCGRWWWAGALAAIVLFGTNYLQGGFLVEKSWRRPLGSTAVSFVRELADPPPEPYSAAADWINANVNDGESILVLPDYMLYPLIFHAPKAIYAWQLNDPHDAQYRSLPPINFKKTTLPDYVIGFGRGLPAFKSLSIGKSQYPLVTIINIHGHDMFRPELIMRTFTPPPPFNPMVDGIRIFKQAPPATSAETPRNPP